MLTRNDTDTADPAPVPWRKGGLITGEKVVPSNCETHTQTVPCQWRATFDLATGTFEAAAFLTDARVQDLSAGEASVSFTNCCNDDMFRASPSNCWGSGFRLGRLRPSCKESAVFWSAWAVELVAARSDAPRPALYRR